MKKKKSHSSNAHLLFRQPNSRSYKKHSSSHKKRWQNEINIISAPSPYYTNTTIEPKFIVLHCIGYKDPLEALNQNKVSCHYLIPQQNSSELIVYEVVKPPLRAWHAGVSKWQEYTGLNDYAIGIEINMPDYAHAIDNNTLDFLYFQDYQPNQLTALKILVKQIQNEYNIPPQNVIGHSDIAPWRNSTGNIIMGKTDPGPTLPWRELANEGIGVWPNSTRCDMNDLSATRAQLLLRNVGYDVPETGVFDQQTNLTIGAARLHWTPECFNQTTGLAHQCYEKPFDANLACSLNNLSPNNNQNNSSSITPLLITMLTVGPVLLILVLVLAYRFLKKDKRNDYEEIEDKFTMEENTTRPSF